MKIIKLTTLLVFVSIFSSNVYAKDIAKGAVEVSGDSSFSISSSESKQTGFSRTEDTDTLSISLTALYYVAPNVGVGLFWEKEDEEVDDGVDSAAFNINILGPTVGFNASISPTESVVFYAGIVLIGDFESEFNGFTTSEGDVNGHVLGVDLKHFVADSFSVNAGFSISSIEIEEDSGDTFETDSTDLKVGLSVYF